MIKNRIKIIVFIFFVLFLILFPNYCNANTNVNENKTFDITEMTKVLSICLIVICFIFVYIAYKLWYKYGKDEQIIDPVEFNPPQGYNPAEIAFLEKGETSKESIVSLLIYLANKGYLKIEEQEADSLEDRVFKIIKLKEYDGNNECEKIFFEGLFNIEDFEPLDVNTIKEVIKESKSYGDDMSFKDAIESAKGVRDSNKGLVTYTTDLNRRFYKVLDKITSILESKKNKETISEPVSKEREKWFILMVIIIFILITIVPIIDYGIHALILLPIALLAPGNGLAMIFAVTLKKNPIPIKIFGLIYGLPWIYFWLNIVLGKNIFDILIYIIGIISMCTIIIFNNKMTKRTLYGNEILGMIRGYKRFLEVAGEQELEELATQHPERFYNILPYIYALGALDKWINQFKTITIKTPHWYNSDNNEIDNFGLFIYTTMACFLKVMSSRPS